MSLRRRTAVRLLIGLLLAAALAGGLWWNATRLNETERKLVGAWHGTTALEALFQMPRSGEIFLADRRQFSIRQQIGSDGKLRWTLQKGYSRWSATPDCIAERMMPNSPSSFTYSEWQNYVERRWFGPTIYRHELTKLADDGFTWQNMEWRSMRRLTNPEVLRLVEQLESGELP